MHKERSRPAGTQAMASATAFVGACHAWHGTISVSSSACPHVIFQGQKAHAWRELMALPTLLDGILAAS